MGREARVKKEREIRGSKEKVAATAKELKNEYTDRGASEEKDKD